MNVTNGLLCLLIAASVVNWYRGHPDDANIVLPVALVAVLAAVVFFLVALTHAGFFGWVVGLFAALAG